MDLGTGVVILCPPDDSDENCDGCTKMGRLGRFMQVLFMPDEHPEEDVHWDVAVVFIVEIGQSNISQRRRLGKQLNLNNVLRR